MVMIGMMGQGIPLAPLRFAKGGIPAFAGMTEVGL